MIESRMYTKEEFEEAVYSAYSEGYSDGVVDGYNDGWEAAFVTSSGIDTTNRIC